MPLTVNARKASFSLAGPDVEPEHWSWALASPAERRAYYLTLGRACIRRKLLELRAGIGVDGRPLKPVKPESRPDGARGQPLSPHDAASRFQRWLRMFAAVDRCTLYWTNLWSRAVRGHMVGWGHLPVRNVVGLTRRHVREAVTEARAGWAKMHGLATPPPAKAPRPPRPVGSIPPKVQPPRVPPLPEPAVMPALVPPAGSPGPVHSPDTLVAARAALAGVTRPSEKNRILHELLAARSAGIRVTARAHGMTAAEEFAVTEFGGIRLHHSPLGTFRQDVIHPAVLSLRQFLDIPPMPAALTGPTRNVYLTEQESDNNSHYARKFNRPGFRAWAEGGRGDVVVYGGKALDPETYAHEAGHNLAASLYGGGIEPAGTSDFMAAARSGEPAPTEYGKSFPSEDFAETMKMFATDPQKLRSRAPRRYEVARRLMEVPGYGG